MNEFKRKQIEKRYENFYEFYNKAIRPIQEQQEVRQVEGLVSWEENQVETERKLVAVK